MSSTNVSEVVTFLAFQLTAELKHACGKINYGSYNTGCHICCRGTKNSDNDGFCGPLISEQFAGPSVPTSNFSRRFSFYGLGLKKFLPLNPLFQ
ncbi:18987_t:CDS:2 [Gigaspora rosea]|nr:18987_t:CDS:2 [Gigaspora rosea]